MINIFNLGSCGLIKINYYYQNQNNFNYKEVGGEGGGGVFCITNKLLFEIRKVS